MPSGRGKRSQNSEEEDRPFDRLHNAFMCYLKRHIVAPISSHPKRILDISRGVGLWAVEVADEHQDVNVTWMNPFYYLPGYTIPENCKFMTVDLSNALEFDDSSVDFVHSRYMFGPDISTNR